MRDYAPAVATMVPVVDIMTIIITNMVRKVQAAPRATAVKISIVVYMKVRFSEIALCNMQQAFVLL